jgi:mono/diheme cytochrome c family protein
MKSPLRPLSIILLLLTSQLIVPPAQASSNKEKEAAGATLFRDKGCAYCHGATAQGTQKGPSLANVRQTLKPAQIADQIVNGGQKMPSFQDSLSTDEVAQLVAYLRAKHRPAPAPLPAPTPAPAPSPAP